MDEPPSRDRRPLRQARSRKRRGSDSEEVGPQRNLELDGVLDILRTHTTFRGGINCDLCGKLYKSRVCFTKHIWEHSVYWDLFQGARNQDRVLAIQAALILFHYHAHHHAPDAAQRTLSEQILALLVTEPREHHAEAKKGPHQGATEP